jgi:hypothetical protein
MFFVGGGWVLALLYVPLCAVTRYTAFVSLMIEYSENVNFEKKYHIRVS